MSTPLPNPLERKPNRPLDRVANRRRRAGFSLIEIMAVVVIMALLMGLVGANVLGRLDVARVQTTRGQIKNLESALAFYQMDNGRYPTTEQGLAALLSRPTTAPEPRNYKSGGYLSSKTTPKDAWGEDFQYQSPGTHNPSSVDIWSNGANGQPGGSETDADIGNWEAETG
ncbi:MAG: type II secretion system major pseudopilin GspG [Deltaproteobacteria bacterium]|nr:type II secretion system major pseudopilin GspG [Deltaproteobacteria bacterium]MBW2394142.1 type II secretion system major pseudopilin GspG [Deltaproteobacteria bacterium]